VYLEVVKSSVSDQGRVLTMWKLWFHKSVKIINKIGNFT